MAAVPFDQDQLSRFRDAVQTMKLYRRAEVEDHKGKSLISKLYVDPLPNEHVLQTMLRPNTTFLIGRKGTGKSTIIQRVQHDLLRDRRIGAAYLDIKTVYESSQADTSLVAETCTHNPSLDVTRVRELLLVRTFVKAVVEGIRDDLRRQLSASFLARAKNKMIGNVSEIFDELQEYLDGLDRSSFIEITSSAQMLRSTEGATATRGSAKASMELSAANASGGIGIEAESSASSTTKEEYSAVLLREFDVRGLITRLQAILESVGVKQLFIFVDDFSELPLVAMESVVDVLLAPLNNWSNELVKLKVAAYPGRVYYGSIDKTKIDEVNLDIYDLYGQRGLREMESKAIEFTKRLAVTRLNHFGVKLEDFVTPRYDLDLLWRHLFYASLGNPRTLGYLLFFVYEQQLIYGRPITVGGVRDAAKKYYNEKVKAYFTIGRFLHESFSERATIFSLKELLDKVVAKARELRNYESATWTRVGRSAPAGTGRPPTSHFYVPLALEGLLSTLELNFFLSRYYVQSDRDGNKVAIYALNYGLCQNNSIEFGRPDAGREGRLYFLDRIFDYAPILQDFLVSNQEIRCDNCSSLFDHSQLGALRMYRMKCPRCARGTCRVTNIARKYEALLREVDQNSLLPATELGILHTLESAGTPMYAAEIAGELDCSGQLIGRRGRKLAERGLVEREAVGARRQYSITDLAIRIYFNDAGPYDEDAKEK